MGSVAALPGQIRESHSDIGFQVNRAGSIEL